ncbi:annexin-like protein 1 [Elsinoe australis]|uniref:Annexin-like protein 1 n=1 Tax=Elsinoe australis TaxID=40998 RepID=A0A4U7B2Q4_9PEZI|nr:annexin-like protein 1 [Elsinoe australis]
MSLRPDDRSSRRRERSRSRSHDDRDRSRSNVRESHKKSSPPRKDRYLVESMSVKDTPKSYQYPAAPSSVAMPFMPPMPGGFEDDAVMPYPRDSMLPGGYPDDSTPYPASSMPLGGGVPYPTSSLFPDPNQFDITGASERERLQDSLAFGHDPYGSDRDTPPTYRDQHGRPEHRRHGSSYDYPSPPKEAPSPNAFYGSSKPAQTQYPPEPHRTSSYEKTRDRSATLDAYRPAPASHLTPSGQQAQVVDFTPGGSRPRASSNLTPHMDRLTIGSAPPTNGGGALPPPSPLLEAYRGTYQSISPMVAPMAAPSDSDLSDLELSHPQTRDMKPSKSSKHSSKHSSSKSKSTTTTTKDKSAAQSQSQPRLPSPPRDPKRRATLYDASADALTLFKSLSHASSSHIPTDRITSILPVLTHDQILSLRKEYKSIARVNGKGINLAKHLKLKLSGNYGKACYVTSLGRWESEGYWASFFYQSAASRRELVIESLMGRTNAEVRAIREEFRDKRYGDDLRKMVERELRADKFRAAVMMVLEEKRQEETEVWGAEAVGRDVAVLRQVMGRREGGETVLLEMCVRRSDAHLREVLRGYEALTGGNFAREALRRSGNLVGEVLAHILNGAINRPARDALLLRHAIQDIKEHNKDEELRYELLISRLVRFHWDKAHLERVKREYATKTGTRLEEDIAAATKGDLRAFLRELCDPRA